MGTGCGWYYTVVAHKAGGQVCLVCPFVSQLTDRVKCRINQIVVGRSRWDAWLARHSSDDRILDTGNYPHAPCLCPNGKLSGGVCSVQLAFAQVPWWRCTFCMHAEGCMSLGGAVELKLPMPVRHPCLASWLLGRTKKKRVVSVPCLPGLLINRDITSCW